MRRESIDPGLRVDTETVATAAMVQASQIVTKDEVYQLFETTPLEAARILDAIFRRYLDIRPFEDEGDDYAIGAEW